MAILVIMLRSHMAIMMIMLRSSISISDDLHPMVRDFQHLVPYFCSAPAREPDAGRPVGPVAPPAAGPGHIQAKVHSMSTVEECLARTSTADR